MSELIRQGRQAIDQLQQAQSAAVSRRLASIEHGRQIRSAIRCAEERILADQAVARVRELYRVADELMLRGARLNLRAQLVGYANPEMEQRAREIEHVAHTSGLLILGEYGGS